MKLQVFTAIATAILLNSAAYAIPTEGPSVTSDAPPAKAQAPQGAGDADHTEPAPAADSIKAKEAATLSPSAGGSHAWINYANNYIYKQNLGGY